MMDFVFCTNKNYIKRYGVLILSILRFAPLHEQIHFHVLGDCLDDADKDALQGVAAMRDGALVSFYVPERSLSKENLQLIDKTLENRKDISRETYYRLLAADLLPDTVHRALYLDGDMVCTGDLSELFEVDLKGCPVGMCYDICTSSIEKYNRLGYPFSEGYFNGGLELFDLDLWRKENLIRVMLEWLAANARKCETHDQDVVNAVLHGRIFPLDFSYDIQPRGLYVFYWIEEEKNGYFASNMQYLPKDEWPALCAAIENPRLVHFSWTVKPWHKECDNPFAIVWRYFSGRSPWKDERFKHIPAKDRIKRMGRRVLERLNLASVQIPPYPEQAREIAQRVLDKLLEEDAR